MKTMHVVYNTDGWLQVYEVPEGTLPKDYYKGILIGPPDLRSLPLKITEILELNNRLVKAGFVEFSNLRGKRKRLLQIIASIIEQDTAKMIRTLVLAIYQKAYYPLSFME